MASQDVDELKWRVHVHIIDITEIRPRSLRQELVDAGARHSEASASTALASMRSWPPREST